MTDWVRYTNILLNNNKNNYTMKKTLCLVATAVLIATASLFTVSCTEEFQVEESQLAGQWYFPLNLAVDTVTGFNWAGLDMTFRHDTMWVAGKTFIWTLRGNNVTATCKPRANVEESWVVAFTVYEADAKSMKISGKYRYLYGEDNTVLGDISCTLTRTNPATTPQ